MALKIYYVDDEPELCELFEDLFSEQDVVIKSFPDPLMALEEINQNPPDVLFMDYRMPGLSGVELAQKTSLEIRKYLISGENNLRTEYPFERILAKPLDTLLIREIIKSFQK